MEEDFRALLEGKANADAWARDMIEVLEGFPPDPAEIPNDKEEAARVVNRAIARGLAMVAVNERYGFAPTVEDFKASVVNAFKNNMTRKLSWGEELCIATEAFYEKGFTFGASGENDTPKQKAIVAADITMRAVKKWQRSGEYGDLADFIADEHSERSANIDPETPRKAIRRFRRAIQGQLLFHFDPDTFTVSVTSHDSIMRGTSRKPGRPRKKI